MNIQQIESTEDNEETIFDILDDIRGAVEALHFQRKVVCEANDCVHRCNDGQCKFTFVSIDFCGQCEEYEVNINQ